MSSATSNVTDNNPLSANGPYFPVFVVVVALSGIIIFAVSVFYYFWMRKFYQRVLKEGAFWDTSQDSSVPPTPMPPTPMEPTQENAIIPNTLEMNQQPPMSPEFAQQQPAPETVATPPQVVVSNDPSTNPAVQVDTKPDKLRIVKIIIVVIKDLLLLAIDVFFVAVSFMKNLRPYSASFKDFSNYDQFKKDVLGNATGASFVAGGIGYSAGICVASFLWAIITPYILTLSFRLAYEPDNPLLAPSDLDPTALRYFKLVMNKVVYLLKQLQMFVIVKALTFFLGYFARQIVVYCIILPIVLFWPIGILNLFFVCCCFTVQGFWVCLERIKELFGKRGVSISKMVFDWFKGVFQVMYDRITKGEVANGSENIFNEIKTKIILLGYLIYAGFIPFCYVFAISMAKHIVKLWLAFPEPQVLNVTMGGVFKSLCCCCICIYRNATSKTPSQADIQNAKPAEAVPPADAVVIDEQQMQQAPVEVAPSPDASQTPDAPKESQLTEAELEMEEHRKEMLQYRNMIPMIDWLNFTSSYSISYVMMIPLIGPFVHLISTTMIRSGFWLLPFWMFPNLYQENQGSIPMNKRPQTIPYDFYKKLFFILWEPFDPTPPKKGEEQQSMLASLKNETLLLERWKKANEYEYNMVDPKKDKGVWLRMLMIAVFPCVAVLYFAVPTAGFDLFGAILGRISIE